MECGEKSVKVENIRKSAIATVKCGHCGSSKDVIVNTISEPVDAFGDFIDIFYADQELQRLEKRIIRLKKDNEYGDLALCYSILSDICRAKASILMEDEDNVNMDDVSKWRLKSEEYKRLEKGAVAVMDSEELEHGLKTDEESLFDEHEEGIKKEKKAEEIWEDPGFLEF